MEILADTGMLRIGADDLEYRWVGPRPDIAPTLVLLHEGLGSAGLWRDFPDRLAAATGYGVFAYSRAGYGGSSACALPRPLDYMQREGEDIVPAVLDAIGFRRGLLIGHSDGASIAAVYAGGHDDPRLAGVVLMAPHFFTEGVGLAAIAAAKRAYETGDLRMRLAKHHGANVDCAFWGWNSAWLDPDFRRWDITRYLPRIGVPMLVVQGEDDTYGTTAQVDAAVVHAGGAVDTCVIPDCGHSPFKEQPDATLQAIVAFARRCLDAPA